MEARLKHLRSSIPKGARILVANLPGNILLAQFFQDQLRFQFDDPTLEVTVLSVAPTTPTMAADMVIHRGDDRTITLDNTGGTAVMVRDEYAFPWTRLEAGTSHHTTSGLTVDVVRGSPDACQELRVSLPAPISDYVVLQWIPSPDRMMHPYYRRLWSDVRRVAP
jgi:hypothetical protein